MITGLPRMSPMILSVTGTIARTATNVRAGARGPVAGMLHAVFLLLFMLLARLLLFPFLHFGNRRGRGDCLLAMAAKPSR